MEYCYRTTSASLKSQDWPSLYTPFKHRAIEQKVNNNYQAQTVSRGIIYVEAGERMVYLRG